MGNVKENKLAGIEKQPDAFLGTPPHYVVIELAVPVDDTKAMAGHDVLADHRFQKFAFALAGTPDDVHVGALPELRAKLDPLPFCVKPEDDGFRRSHSEPSSFLISSSYSHMMNSVSSGCSFTNASRSSIKPALVRVLLRARLLTRSRISSARFGGAAGRAGNR